MDPAFELIGADVSKSIKTEKAASAIFFFFFFIFFNKKSFLDKVLMPRNFLNLLAYSFQRLFRSH
jgi:hypothetical protein